MKRNQTRQGLMMDIARPMAPKQSQGSRPHKFYKKLRSSLGSNRAIWVVVVLIVFGGGAYLYHANKGVQIKNGADASNSSQIDIVVEKVGKLILLPSGEQPTMAIVNDASKYNNVSFFKNAANGDRLLVYAQAHEVILYRPSINKIIAVAPLNASPQSTTPTDQ